MESKIITLILITCFSFIGFSQSIDSTSVTIGNPSVLYVKGTMPLLDLAKVEIVSLNDMNNTQVVNLYFKGCPINQMVQPFDTSIILSAPYPFDLQINTYHDTSANCSYPISTTPIDNLHLTASQIVGVDDLIKMDKKIKVYPVPAKDHIIIEKSEETIIDTIELLNLAGKRVLQFNANETVLDVSNLPAASYFLIITMAGKQLSTKIVIK